MPRPKSTLRPSAGSTPGAGSSRRRKKISGGSRKTDRREQGGRTGHPRHYYPVFLDLRDRLCVVVGGGKVAERKALGLLEAGARLRVISPALTPRLEKEKAEGGLEHIARKYRGADLVGAFLVIAATDEMDENERVAGEKDLLVNVVDMPEICNFIVPSTLRRGPLVIAVSTSGASPAMARAVRRDLEGLYGKEFGLYLRRLSRERERAFREISDPRRRNRFLKSLASAEIVGRLREGILPERL